VLHDGDDPVGHEPPGADDLAAAGDLSDLDDAAAGGHLDPPAGSGGLDLEPLGTAPGVHHDLDAVPLHVAILGPPGFPRREVWRILWPGKHGRSEKGETMKKFLILLGIIGLVIAVTMYVRNRQGESEF
jgi:hypothetical protein